MDKTTAEITRCLQNMIIFGVVAEVDHKAARVRINSGDLKTDWLPWLVQSAGEVRSWRAPSIGEQVVLLSPGGDLAGGVVLMGIYSNARVAPSDKPNLDTIHYPDEAVIAYDHDKHKLIATLPEDSSVIITATKLTVIADLVTLDAADTICTGNLTVTENLTVNGLSSLNAGMAVSGAVDGDGGVTAFIDGTMAASNDVIAGDISLKYHIHGGVRSGDSSTGVATK